MHCWQMQRLFFSLTGSKAINCAGICNVIHQQFLESFAWQKFFCRQIEQCSADETAGVGIIVEGIIVNVSRHVLFM